MTFEIKPVAKQTEELLDKHDDPARQRHELIHLCRKLERELIACGHEQLRCAGCGAGQNNTKELTEDWQYCGPVTYLHEGAFTCPLCGHENHWKRVSRFVTT